MVSINQWFFPLNYIYMVYNGSILYITNTRTFNMVYQVDLCGLPSGNQTWQLDTPHKWRILAGQIRHFSIFSGQVVSDTLEIDEIVRKIDISFHPIVSNIIFPRRTLQICWGIHLFGQKLNTYIKPSFR